MAQRPAPNWERMAAQKAETQTARAQPRPTPTRQIATVTQNMAVERNQRAHAAFWDKHPSGLDPVLTADQKDWLAENRTVFPVIAVKYTTGGTYGATWWVTVEVEGQRFGAPFQDNDQRHDMYTDMKAHVDQYGALPVSIRSYETQAGVGYDLCAPYEPDQLDGDTDDDGDTPF